MAAIGIMIKRLRAQQGWSQRELARKARLSEVTVARLECGMRNDPPLSTLKKLAKALRVPIAELLD